MAVGGSRCRPGGGGRGRAGQSAVAGLVWEAGGGGPGSRLWLVLSERLTDGIGEFRLAGRS